MDAAILEFNSELVQEAHVVAESEGLSFQEAFGHVMVRQVGDLEIATDLAEFHAECRGPRNRVLSVMAVGEDAADDSMSVIVGRFFESPDATLTMNDITRAFDGARVYVEAGVGGWLQERLEDSSPEYDLADYFRDRLRNISKMKIVLVSNGTMTSRLTRLEDGEVLGVPVSFAVWDVERLFRASQSPTGHEPIRVELVGPSGEGVPCVAGGSTIAGTSSYLFTLTGRQLADIYDMHGSRVLESNVRGFLSIRGKVNKGIQWTLDQRPEMFLAYNNGLTTTATHAEIDHIDGTLQLKALTDWQIVNGGQTTASMWYFLNKNKARRKDKLEHLDTAHVQVKLVVVDPERASEIVPDIARFANSQNKVSGSDFFSNSPYHKRLENLSRKVLAPAQQGLQYETHWFYERTRGAYDNEKAKLAPTAARKFLLAHPKAQKFDKIDVARVENIWAQRPDVVSRGAQTSFVEFSRTADEMWESRPERVNDKYFKELVAKIIVTKAARKLVMYSEWWGKGYLANIVAYGVAKLLYDLEDMFPGHELDLREIWTDQDCNEMVLENLEVACRAALEHLQDPDRPVANVTQWAKQVQCWETLKDSPLEYYTSAHDIVVPRVELLEEKAEAASEQVLDTKARTYIDIVTMDRQVWAGLSEFSAENGLLTEKESSILQTLLQKGIVSEGQADVLSGALRRAERNGLILG